MKLQQLASCLLVMAVGAMAEPSPIFNMANVMEKFPPLLRSLLLPSISKKAIPDSDFQQRSEEKSHVSTTEPSNDPDYSEAEVVVDASASPSPLMNSTVVHNNNGTKEIGNNGTIDKDPREHGESHDGQQRVANGFGQPPTDKESDHLPEEKHTSWKRLTTAASAFVAVLRGDVAASKQIVDIGELPNLIDVLRRGGIDIDLTNGRINFDFNVIVTELVVVAVPIVVTALVMGYMWILFGLVEFDYTVFGPHERIVPNVVPGTYAEKRIGIIDSDGSEFINPVYEKQLQQEKR